MSLLSRIKNIKKDELIKEPKEIFKLPRIFCKSSGIESTITIDEGFMGAVYETATISSINQRDCTFVFNLSVENESNNDTSTIPVNLSYEIKDDELYIRVDGFPERQFKGSNFGDDISNDIITFAENYFNS